MPWPSLVADRYLPLSLAGRGAFAEVWRSLDMATGEVVALKRTRLTHRDPPDGRRREVAVMRALRFPGVVRLREVIIEGRYEILVMDWAEGAPFPGAPGPMAWPRLRPLVLALAETLRDIHSVGLRHNDLKPDNVLVDLAHGRVTVLDFNLAAERPNDDGGGTIMTMAPEVLRGGSSTLASDLYSFGVVIAYGLLGDWPPHDHLAAALSSAPLTPLRLEGVDPEAAAWVEALTQPDPAKRRLPRPADDQLDAALSVVQAQADRAEALFLGPQEVHHLPEDAARILSARAGDDPAAQRAELAAWVRLGDARLREGRIEVSRAALQRLDEPPALRAALARQEQAEIVQVALARAAALAEVGRLADACQFLQLALVWRAPDDDARDVAETLAVYSLAQEQPVPIREARMTIERCLGESALTQLLEAYQAALEGEIPFAGQSAERLAPFESERLEIWRVATLVLVAKRRGEGESRLEALGPALSARGPLARSKVLRWWGQERYLAGRYDEAIALITEGAAASGLRLDERIATMLQLASHTLETGRLNDAARLAREAQALAAPARLTLYEARAIWIAEAAAARANPRLGPNQALIEAFEHLSVVELAAWIRLTYGGAALRRRELGVALELGRGCAALLTHHDLAAAQVLAQALIGLCGGEPFDAEALHARLDRLPLRSVRLRIQALAAVACRGEATLARRAVAELEALVPTLPDPDRVLELLSASESLQIARHGAL